MTIKMLRWIAAALFAALLAACGGGGGSPGTTATGGGTGSGGGGGGSTVTPTLVLSLVDSNDAAITSHAVTSGTLAYAKAVVTDATGAKVVDKLVSFSAPSGLLTFSPPSGQVLTDTSGVAKVQVSPASLNSSGAGTLSASAVVGAQTLTDAIDIQTSPAQVALANFSATQSSLTAFQSTGVSVDVTVNGQSAAATPLTVAFSASCGSFSPASVTSNSSSKATSTYAAAGCSGGPATLTASTVGAPSVQTTLTVQSPTPTNLLFVSASPSTIYTSVAAFGVKQSQVVFKVVDASGAAVTTPTSVQLSLSASAIAAGVTFADTNSTAPKTVSTDANGLVSVIVQSGAVPTPLAITGTLVSNPLISASSAGLSVNSGRPSQAFFSMSASSQNIEGWQYDGQTSTIQIYLADRLGQPVPAGTPVSFVTEGGQITASCLVTIDANNKSGCTVSLLSQNFRPADGRVTVLAYAEGEEVFVDANGNNQYDSGETFYDMGQLFIDSNENGVADTGEQKIGDATIAGSGIGTAACTTHPNAATANPFLIANVASTCDGVWGPTRVRENMVIAFSTSFGHVASAQLVSSIELDFILEDLNHNAMPSDSVVSATVQGGVNCALDSVIPSKVASTPNPTFHSALLAASGVGATCSGATVSLKVTTPKGNQTLLGTYTMP
jgi:hypothetical protein